MDCTAQTWLDAQDAVRPPIEHRMAAAATPPGAGKGFYGTPAGDTWVTDNFGVVWLPGEATLADAQLAGEALEAGWEAMVVARGWTPPHLSDSYLVWVVLDPWLGVPGRTEQVVTEEVPGGYPVISLDPRLASDDPEAFRLEAAHQWAHALQHRIRAFADTDAEAWHWEASAVYASAITVGGTAWAAEADGFLSAPELRFDSRVGGHDRGMFLLDRWLEGRGTSLEAVWETARWLPGEPWDAILAEAAGEPADTVFASFAADAGNGRLDQAELFGSVHVRDPLVSGVAGTLPRYGIDYYAHVGAEPVQAELLFGADRALLAVPGQVGTAVRVEPGQRLAVIGVQDLADYQVFTAPAPADPVEPPADRGRADPSELYWARPQRGCDAAGGTCAGWLFPVLPLVALRTRGTSRTCRSTRR